MAIFTETFSPGVGYATEERRSRTESLIISSGRMTSPLSFACPCPQTGKIESKAKTEPQRYRRRLPSFMRVLPFFFPAAVRSGIAGSGRGEEPSGAKGPPPDSDPFSDVESGENLVSLSRQFPATTNRRFQSDKAVSFSSARTVKAVIRKRALP